MAVCSTQVSVATRSSATSSSSFLPSTMLSRLKTGERVCNCRPIEYSIVSRFKFMEIASQNTLDILEYTVQERWVSQIKVFIFVVLVFVYSRGLASRIPPLCSSLGSQLYSWLKAGRAAAHIQAPPVFSTYQAPICRSARHG